jgi:hypothetical protein
MSIQIDKGDNKMKKLLIILTCLMLFSSYAYAAPKRIIWVDDNEQAVGTESNPVTVEVV